MAFTRRGVNIHPDTKRRLLQAYKDLKASGPEKGEVTELADAYGVEVKTINAWIRKERKQYEVGKIDNQRRGRG